MTIDLNFHQIKTHSKTSSKPSFPKWELMLPSSSIASFLLLLLPSWGTKTKYSQTKLWRFLLLTNNTSIRSSPLSSRIRGKWTDSTTRARGLESVWIQCRPSRKTCLFLLSRKKWKNKHKNKFQIALNLQASQPPNNKSLFCSQTKLTLCVFSAKQSNRALKKPSSFSKLRLNFHQKIYLLPSIYRIFISKAEWQSSVLKFVKAFCWRSKTRLNNLRWLCICITIELPLWTCSADTLSRLLFCRSVYNSGESTIFTKTWQMHTFLWVFPRRQQWTTKKLFVWTPAMMRLFITWRWPNLFRRSTLLPS